MQKSSTLRDFQILSRLGQGSFASVYKVRRLDDSSIYALKKVKLGQMGIKEKENAVNQVRILASASHPNIINYKEAFFDDQSETLCIVMQIAEGGDIMKKSNEHIKNKTYFNEAQIWKALIHMTKGLKSLHDMNILHRDLKCANIFVTNEGEYKLGDLNVSKVSKKGMAKTHTGTPYYTAPEVWKDKEYDLKCDIWSLGCVIYEMAALKPPFRANNLRQLYNKIQKGIFQRIPTFYSEDLNNMITWLIKVNPSLRPTTVQILTDTRVGKYTSPMDYYKPEPKQGNLLKTIIVPKNLRQLKDALPGAKYGSIDVEGDRARKLVGERASSVRSLRGNGGVGDQRDRRRQEVLNSFRRMTPSKGREYSYDHIKQREREVREGEISRNYSRERERERQRQQEFKDKERQRQRSITRQRQQSRQRQRVPMSNIPRIRSRQNINVNVSDLSVNKSREKYNMQLKKQHAEVSKNVERALEKVGRVVERNQGGGSVSSRGIVKPRSQSMDRGERVERAPSREKERQKEKEKENKYRIFVPPINRPPSSNRNNVSKKYLPPQSKLY